MWINYVWIIYTSKPTNQTTECIYELQNKVEDLQNQINKLREEMKNAHR